MKKEADEEKMDKAKVEEEKKHRKRRHIGSKERKQWCDRMTMTRWWNDGGEGARMKMGRLTNERKKGRMQGTWGKEGKIKKIKSCQSF